MVRRLGVIGLLAAMSVGAATAADAQVVQGFQLGVGAVYPRGFDGRVDNDVLVADLTDKDALLFEVRDFRTAQLFGEWTFGFGDHIEAAAGVGLYGRTVPSIYRDFVNKNGTEIEQDLKLRVIPLTAIVRFLPFGRPGDVQPYVGVGVGALNFRYSEAGSFIDATTRDVFTDRFVKTGTALGTIILGGIRFPLGGDIYGLAVEGRYVTGQGDLGGLQNGFLGDTIDLGNTQLNFTFHIRF